MVSYQIAPEQQDLRDSVAQFARDVVAPVIGGYYERGEFPYDIVAKMGKLGLFGLPFPEEYGGMGGDYFALCLALRNWPGWIPRSRSPWRPGSRSARCPSTGSAPPNNAAGGCPSCARGSDWPRSA
jgi:alkylation response protein AidB-like acyl-CoA dehydrogenase